MKKNDLDALRAQARDCRACTLWRHATQTVFGEGNARAPIMLVGEQPGDIEDQKGRPFVGPAGAVLDKALADAALARESVYVTNAVRHFKWEPRGKRRLHKTPAQQEIEACRQWLERELELIKPSLIVAMGTTAARAVLGRAVTLTRMRGRIMPRDNAPAVLLTVHPSYILRVPPQSRDQAYEDLVHDLRVAAHLLQRG